MMFPPCTTVLFAPEDLVELEPAPEYKPAAGCSLDRAAEYLCRRAALEGRPWTMVFNGTPVVAEPGDEPMDVMKQWDEARR